MLDRDSQPTPHPLRTAMKRVTSVIGDVVSRRRTDRPAERPPVPDEHVCEHRFQLFPPGHYYSPVPDLDDVWRRRDVVFQVDPADVPGVDLRLEQQWTLLEALAAVGDDPFDGPDETRYRRDNEMYAHGDGAVLWRMLRHLAPERYFEIGSGYTSALVLDYRDRHSPELAVTLVEPYTDRLMSLLRPGDLETFTLQDRPAQSVAPEDLRHLGRDDILFIDSTHVLKIDSDVHHELFRLLPSLGSGVVVHFHDIFPGFVYPEEWVFAGRNWNEAYALRAFLQFNAEFEVLLWPSLLHAIDRERAERLLPMLATNAGGALWLRRR